MESERICFIVRKISRRAVLLLGGALTLTALTGCWPSGISSSEQTKNAEKTALKAAVEQSEDSYNLVENKALSVKARAILEAYLKEVEARYTDVFEPQNVTHIWPTDVTVGDDGFGTAVFSMPENAVVIRRRGKELRMHWWQIFCIIINTMAILLSTALKL